VTTSRIKEWPRTDICANTTRTGITVMSQPVAAPCGCSGYWTIHDADFIGYPAFVWMWAVISVCEFHGRVG
jgi:hypothetical protein